MYKKTKNVTCMNKRELSIQIEWKVLFEASYFSPKKSDSKHNPMFPILKWYQLGGLPDILIMHLV